MTSNSHEFMQQVLAMRTDTTSRAAISEGMHEWGRPYAAAYIAPAASASNVSLDVAFPLAALCALNPNVAQTTSQHTEGEEKTRLAPAAADLSRLTQAMALAGGRKKSKTGGMSVEEWLRDPVARRISRLPLLDTQQAIEELDGALSQIAAKVTHPAINWFDLASVLTRWGYGVSDASRRTRTAFLTTYYSN